ncbi:HpcH/HpaI aldolase/citrate lyase family protein [Bradyrhizobium commune]|uniref:CoA ester lyase n=1 Tax=Bradyrhizobium commune TaxID=83627 RepID=A0A7S9D3W1_9BRAD|nr:CoA ester lyase [Bradyrhizobium commune]QPF90725.1 CoA ester lyase [Bradyrhizobium commune]
MSSRTKRARRAQLAVPATTDKLLAKAAQNPADHVFLDLEDAVAPTAKKQAREQVIRALNELEWDNKVRCVRINDLSNPNCYQDIVEIVSRAGANLDTIMVPKVKVAADIHFVVTLLEQVEKQSQLNRKIGIEVIIEDVDAVHNAFEIARSSERVEALIFGAGDFAASMGIDMRAAERPGQADELWYFARYQMVMAARSVGIDAIDSPILDVRDVDAYTADARRGLAMGFTGKWAIHPLQVAPAMEVFTPAREKVEFARRVVSAYAEAEAKGIGSILFEGQMLDAAVVRNHRLLVEHAQRMGL